MLCITYCQYLFEQKGRDTVLIPPVTTWSKDMNQHRGSEGKTHC